MLRVPPTLVPTVLFLLATTGYPLVRSLLDAAPPDRPEAVPALQFDSAASLLDESGAALTDDAVVAVRAEATATTEDADDEGDSFGYDREDAIPLVAVDRSVVGVGSVLVADGTNWQYGNEEFLVNVWDETMGEAGTVVWDEGHGQWYDRSRLSTFESYAAEQGHEIRWTATIADALGDADGAVIAAPTESFTSEERDALAAFVDEGGALFLHGQSDFHADDPVGPLNEIADALGLAFRFDDAQVLDPVLNAGDPYRPTTNRFTDRFPYFDPREGLGLDREQTYTVSVTSAADGDTVDVEFPDGRAENVRVLDVDTPEKASNREHERVEEWEGIEDVAHLQTWAETATQFATEELVGKTVELSFDPGSAVRDEYGRLLGRIAYDATGDGATDDAYNRALVANGFARVYDGSTTSHDAVLAAERAARRKGRGLWAASDPSATAPIRDDPVEALFFPKAATVCTENGPVGTDRVPVTAAASASQHRHDDEAVSYDYDLPLVAVDDAANVAAVGAPLFDEQYEPAEGYPVDTTDYGNYVFLTNLVEFLTSSDRASGAIAIEGGHGQFPVGFGHTAEDAAYYLRYLEGQGISLVGINDVTGDGLSRARALLVTAAPEPFTDAEIDAVATFLEDGGALVLVGTGLVTPGARETLNHLAAGVGTDLRLNADRVVDEERDVGGDRTIPVTSAFDRSFPLFDAVGGATDGGRRRARRNGTTAGELAVVDVEPRARGQAPTPPDDERVVFENVGDERLSLTGWTVRNEGDRAYTFPDGFVLRPGCRVRLHTESGADRQTDLYWGSNTAIWTRRGDAVIVEDASGSTVLRYTP